MAAVIAPAPANIEPDSVALSLDAAPAQSPVDCGSHETTKGNNRLHTVLILNAAIKTNPLEQSIHQNDIFDFKTTLK